MQKNLTSIALKLLLGGFELLFVGVLAYMRFLDMGWLLIIFGLFLVLWVIVHLALMTAFLGSFRISLIDIALYLAVHFFYLAAWLFQSDGGDSGEVAWVIQQIYDSAAMSSFLQKWGDNLFYAMLAGTLFVYVLIAGLLVIRLIRFLRARRSAPTGQ